MLLIHVELLHVIRLMRHGENVREKVRVDRSFLGIHPKYLDCQKL